MSEFEEDNKLTLEKIIGKVHQEIGESITSMSREVSDIPDFISRFLQGKEGWAGFRVQGHRKIAGLHYEDFIERVKLLYEQAESIFLEKGYRHSSALLTAREHKQVGSSGYEGYLVMPDTVVSIAEQTLNLITDDERKMADEMTIEEIRKARILYCMSTIDDTGTVTGEIVPITDSYHFLSEERTAEVKGLEQRIISELKGIVSEAVARKAASLTNYKDIITELAGGKLSRANGYSKVEGLNMSLKVAEEAIKLAYQDGCKDNILTPMEILLLGREAGEKFKSNPYTPLGVQKGRISIEEANKARKEERFFDVETNVFTGYLYPVALSLEPLNEEGKTERGPVVLDHIEKEPILDRRLIDMWKLTMKAIPFSRPVDWYHKPVDSPQLQQ